MHCKLSHFHPSDAFHPPPRPVSPRSFFFLSAGSPSTVMLSSGRLCESRRQSSSVMSGDWRGAVDVSVGDGVALLAGLWNGMGASLLMSERRSTAAVGSGVAVVTVAAVVVSRAVLAVEPLLSTSNGAACDSIAVDAVPWSTFVTLFVSRSTASSGGSESVLSTGGASSGGGASFAGSIPAITMLSLVLSCVLDVERSTAVAAARRGRSASAEAVDVMCC